MFLTRQNPLFCRKLKFRFKFLQNGNCDCYIGLPPVSKLVNVSVSVCVAGRRARWLMPPQTWTTRKPSASSTTTTDQAALGSGRQSVPAPNCSSAHVSRPWQVRGHAHVLIQTHIHTANTPASVSVQIHLLSRA